MKLTFIVTAITLTSLLGCSSMPVVDMHGAHTAKGHVPTGDRFTILVWDGGGSQIPTSPDLKKSIENAAVAWLEKRGYHRETQDWTKPHSHVNFFINRSKRSFTYPGETQRELHDVQLVIEVFSYEHGKRPLRSSALFVEQTYGTHDLDLDEEFLTRPAETKNAVAMLLANSVYGNVEKAPPPTSSELPLCWPILGVRTDPEAAKDQRQVIVGFKQGGSAQTAGLKAGDQIIEVNGVSADDQWPPALEMGKAAEVTFLRDWKDQKTSVQPTLRCGVFDTDSFLDN